MFLAIKHRPLYLSLFLLSFLFIEHFGCCLVDGFLFFMSNIGHLSILLPLVTAWLAKCGEMYMYVSSYFVVSIIWWYYSLYNKKIYIFCRLQKACWSIWYHYKALLKVAVVHT